MCVTPHPFQQPHCDLTSRGIGLHLFVETGLSGGENDPANVDG
jgi:hypothetical protein